MMHVLWAVGAASLLAWIGLLLARGGYWRVSPRLVPPPADDPLPHPPVVAVIPARNEADVLPETLPTVLAQRYPGPFRVVLLDDRSEDGTATAAKNAAAIFATDRLQIVPGAPLPSGWSGKVWAMHQGALAACHQAERPEFLWLTDADVAHEPWVLQALVDRAETEQLDLVSAMARLRVDSAWDRLLVPAFVYFFAKLYPFRFVGDPRRRNAGAAGGCILVRRGTLERAGGFEAIRSALIDDCALARRIKRAGGRLWLGFSRGVTSVRRYGRLASVWAMVARSAYTQLGHSPPMVIGTVIGMLFLYALPPAACLGGAVAAALAVPGALALAVIGGAGWVLMAASFVPIVRHHGVGPWCAGSLPAAGVLYTAMVISSAWRHARGRGGAWKGRTY